MTEFSKSGISVFLHFVFLPAFFALSCLGFNTEPFALAVLFIVLGIFNGGMDDVWSKAAAICTECIGLG